MHNALLDPHAAQRAQETDRHAYNAAFEALGLSWHWDAATYEHLHTLAWEGRERVKTYLQAEQSHLLRAYDADFLTDAIEAAKARCLATMTRQRAAISAHTARQPGATPRMAA